MAQLQTLPVAAMGGLDTVSPPQVIASHPGMATRLENYEALTMGGYRKINGYSHYGDVPDAFNTQELRGIAYYKGIVVVVGDNILHSYNGATWYVINKKGMTTPIKDVDTVPLDKLPRGGSEPAGFQVFLEGDKEVIVVTDDKSLPSTLYYDEDAKTYTYKESNNKDTVGYRHVTKYQDHVVVGGSLATPGNIAVSTRFKSDDYSGSGSWGAQVADEIIGLKTFRDFLYIFCRHSIYRVQNLESSKDASIRPVTTKVGCVDGRTIQEIGGDVLFLADDGLRYLGATERIDDVSLNLVSSPIRSIVDTISPDSGPIDSVVLPEKAQYRLFFTNKLGKRLGLIGTLLPEGNFAWSTMGDLNVDAITDSVLNKSTGEQHIYHIGKHLGSYAVYLHDTGYTFDGTPFKATWDTPYFTMGDAGVRKSLHDVMIYLEAEDSAQLELTVMLDHEDTQVLQPEPFELAAVVRASRFGQAVYGTSTYGAIRYPLESLFLEGSGKWIKLVLQDSSDDNSPYIIRGFDLQFNTGGRI